ncbi:RNA-binding protein [Chloroflexia bacterium SDU3-3]|nr:RNA-binding protein [Chloroflexia bacterium SDU3-3]
MQAKLFVGNLSWNIGDADLEEVFSAYGEVKSARVITDRETGRSRGFGFVEIEANDINTVISQSNGQEVDGRPLRVNEAEDKGGFGGGNRGGGNRGGGSRGGGRW